MRRFLLLALVLVGCSNSVAPRPRPDPFVTVWVRDQYDSTSARGQSTWTTFVILSGPVATQNGWGQQGSLGPTSDPAQRFSSTCESVSADSLSERLALWVALTDTVAHNIPNATMNAKIDSLQRGLVPQWP